MSAFQWNENFSVGNQDIDNQHKKWFELLNKAHDRMLRKIEGDINNIGPEALEAVKKYTEFHFSFEENYMEEINFNELDRHKRLHRAFINKIDTICSDIQIGRIVLNSEIIKLLKNWLIDHILHDDQKFKIS